MSYARIFALWVVLAAGVGVGVICVWTPTPAIAGGSR